MRRRRWSREKYLPHRPLSGRGWLVVFAFAASAVVMVVGVVEHRREPLTPHARELSATLASIPVLAARPPHRDDYDRTAFGDAWSDASDVVAAHNDCDTRNDVLARDLVQVRTGETSACPRAVMAGELRSPYTGKFIVFRRGRNSSDVQIDHIVPLSYAWDMGAYAWPSARRLSLANDPANLVAVDGASNQTKSDAEPARWMPPAKAFHCQYATQFVLVIKAYGLFLDAPSKRVLARAIRRC